MFVEICKEIVAPFLAQRGFAEVETFTDILVEYVLYERHDLRIGYTFEKRDFMLQVTFTELHDGRLIGFPIPLGLAQLVAFRDPSANLDCVRISAPETETSLRQAVNRSRDLLEKDASDVLNGDLSVFKEAAAWAQEQRARFEKAEKEAGDVPPAILPQVKEILGPVMERYGLALTRTWKMPKLWTSNWETVEFSGKKVKASVDLDGRNDSIYLSLEPVPEQIGKPATMLNLLVAKQTGKPFEPLYVGRPPDPERVKAALERIVVWLETYAGEMMRGKFDK